MEEGRVNALSNLNDLELHSFLVDPNFHQFINLISGDQTIDENPSLDFDLGPLQNNSPCFIDENQFIPTPVDDLFDELPDLDANVAESFRSFDGESAPAGGDDDYNDGDDSSATTTNNDGSRKTKTDRSRTLISERRRRGRMKDKLYALRSLVPNITKVKRKSKLFDSESSFAESWNKNYKIDGRGMFLFYFCGIRWIKHP